MRTKSPASGPSFQSTLRLASGLVVLGLTVVGTAAAAAPSPSLVLEPRLVGEVTWTATSGHTSPSSEVLEPSESASQLGIRGFAWSERSDRPCWIEATFTALAGSGYLKDVVATCSYHPASRKDALRGGFDEVVTGVAVCLTDRSSSTRERMKGLRVWGRTVNPETGALGPVNGPAEATRKHCKGKWSRRVNCPEGQVAAMATVYGLRFGDSTTSVKGISLGCRAVAMRPAAQPLPTL